jgi:hypothetical protein
MSSLSTLFQIKPILLLFSVTHTLSGQRTPSALYYLLQQIKEEKVPLLPDWIGLDSIEIGPTHTLLFIFSRMYSENIGFHSQGERRLTSVYTYMHEPFFLLEIDAKGKKIVLGLFLFWLLFLF